MFLSKAKQVSGTKGTVTPQYFDTFPLLIHAKPNVTVREGDSEMDSCRWDERRPGWELDEKVSLRW